MHTHYDISVEHRSPHAFSKVVRWALPLLAAASVSTAAMSLVSSTVTQGSVSTPEVSTTTFNYGLLVPDASRPADETPAAP